MVNMIMTNLIEITGKAFTEQEACLLNSEEDIDNENTLNQTASMLYEAFPHSWTNMQEALEKVYECSSNGRISIVSKNYNISTRTLRYYDNKTYPLFSASKIK
jgi:hypothetical protein